MISGVYIKNQHHVWAADITYIPMARGFMYLVVILDWYSRYVLAWRLSNTLDSYFCVEALREALKKGHPGIFLIRCFKKPFPSIFNNFPHSFATPVKTL